jgi:hypothetical protein
MSIWGLKGALKMRLKPWLLQSNEQDIKFSGVDESAAILAYGCKHCLSKKKKFIRPEILPILSVLTFLTI